MKLLLGIDPGGTTGYGMLKLEGRILTVQDFGVTKDPTLLEIEHLFDQADIVIFEDFKVDPRFARKGAFDFDDMPASRVIGAVETLAALKKKSVQKQSSSVKPVGYGMIGKQYQKGKKNMHHWDALAHAAYYAVKKLAALPVGSA